MWRLSVCEKMLKRAMPMLSLECLWKPLASTMAAPVHKLSQSKPMARQ